MRIVLCGLLLLGGLLGGDAIAQELQCDVTVNVENIPTAQRDYLRNFESELERYMNSTRFTDEDMMGDKIVCTMDVFFKSVSGESRYLTQFFVASQRPMYIGNDKSERVSPIVRIMDEKCEFTYIPNQRMYQDDLAFDALTDLLDYYAYVMIGLDVETYTPLSGARWFQKALNICQLGSTGSYSSAWQLSSASYSRMGLATELTDVKYNAIRNAFNSYHFDGIDLLQTDQRGGLANMLKAIETINDERRRQNPTSVLVKQFFDSKYREIGDAFVNYGDAAVFDQLSTYDPEHRSYYQDKKSGS